MPSLVGRGCFVLMSSRKKTWKSKPSFCSALAFQASAIEHTHNPSSCSWASAQLLLLGSVWSMIQLAHQPPGAEPALPEATWSISVGARKLSLLAVCFVRVKCRTRGQSILSASPKRTVQSSLLQKACRGRIYYLFLAACNLQCKWSGI